jgi:hypothetical protein
MRSTGARFSAGTLRQLSHRTPDRVPLAAPAHPSARDANDARQITISRNFRRQLRIPHRWPYSVTDDCWWKSLLMIRLLALFECALADRLSTNLAVPGTVMTRCYGHAPARRAGFVQPRYSSLFL